MAYRMRRCTGLRPSHVGQRAALDDAEGVFEVARWA